MFAFLGLSIFSFPHKFEMSFVIWCIVGIYFLPYLFRCVFGIGEGGNTLQLKYFRIVLMFLQVFMKILLYFYVLHKVNSQ